MREARCSRGSWSHLLVVCLFVSCSSYRPAVFAKAARILRKRAILAEPSIRRFEDLTHTLAALSESMQDLEAILGEIPDEFSDQLMGVLMTVRQIPDPSTARAWWRLDARSRAHGAVC